MKGMPRIALFLCLTLLIFGGTVMVGAAGRDSDVERAALMRLYESMDGSYWFNNEGWGGPDSYCTWYGVTCDAENHVFALDLGGNLLVGQIPAEIEDLAYLQRLDLSFNGLMDPLPEALGNLAQLRVLDLSNSEYCMKWCFQTLGGPIPLSLGRLSNLQVLDLSGNVFSGTIPAQLGDLARLQTLDLSDNLVCKWVYFPPDAFVCSGGLHGIIPAELSALPLLQALSLQGNKSLCWQTTAAKYWALALPQFTGPVDCSYMPLVNKQ
jgi:hypothetical protein